MGLFNNTIKRRAIRDQAKADYRRNKRTRLARVARKTGHYVDFKRSARYNSFYRKKHGNYGYPVKSIRTKYKRKK